MEFDRKKLKRKFPHLYKELGEPEEQDSVRLGVQATNPCSTSGYAPEVTSYIRRARTNNEALEVIGYLRKRGEISGEQANSLTKQIEEKGVRSFGSVRAWGDYEREFRQRSSENLDGEVEEDEDQGLD